MTSHIETLRRVLDGNYERIYERKKEEKAAEHRRNGSLKAKLEELKEARAAGLLTDAEFEAKKAALLADF